MEYRGTIEDGFIWPDQPVDLPNGTPVEFHAVNGSFKDLNGDHDALAEADKRARSSRTLDQIIAEQGKVPIQSIDSLGGAWPDDEDDTDELIRSVKESRR